MVSWVYCPKCGTVGRIAEGEYDALAGEVVARLNNLDDRNALVEMKLIVESALETKDFTNARAKLNESLSNWKNAFNLLPEDDVVGALAMINTAIAAYALDRSPVIEQDTFIDQSYNQFYLQSNECEPPTAPSKSKPFQMKPSAQAIKRIPPS